MQAHRILSFKKKNIFVVLLDLDVWKYLVLLYTVIVFYRGWFEFLYT